LILLSMNIDKDEARAQNVMYLLKNTIDLFAV